MADHLDPPAELTARPAGPEDAQAVFELVAAHEEAVQGESDVALAEILSTWRRPSFDLATDSIAVFEGERMVAEAEVFQGQRAEAMVHPEAWGRGIGTWLLGWTERRALEAGGTLVGQTVQDSLTAAVELFGRHGYEPMWTSWILEMALDGPQPEPALPAGFAFRPFVAGRDEHPFFELTERAFSEWPDRDAGSFEDWRASMLEGDEFDPDLLLQIHRRGELAGASLCFDVDDEGWVQTLAVAREYRGAGLGRALLQRSFAEFHRRGKAAVRLNTDSRTGALGWYERAGMQVVRCYTHHAKRL